MGPTDLSEALKGLNASNDPNLLVGFDTSDDAAVYRVSPEIALISTVDYITPPVDDPYWFGQIAAANSLSDIYAMGGQPLTALNLVMFPSKKLDMIFLKEILRGGNDKVLEAGASMAGGHSVDDNEPKYGLAVTGKVHPDHVLTNCGAQVGDALILTKPLGTGVLFNANRSGKLPYAELESILPQIAALNRNAIEVALKFDVHACTDVTGYGILGHTLELARGNAVQIELIYENLPFYPNALRMYEKGETTGSNKANRKMAEGAWESGTQPSAAEQELLFDPQTSGGLLLVIPAAQADDLIASLKIGGIETAVRVGEVVAADQPFVRVV
ncbi:MAG: selenide, water dikinase SelD [Deltaproteobacteria bacterium]|nr:selenide, water dikinase SelD [Deltaproteobacteria bacterium]